MSTFHSLTRHYLVLAIAVCTSAAALAASPAPDFKSVKVDLPFGDRVFPDGPHVDAISNNCLACHSAGMVLVQPPMSRKDWTAEVEKMRAVYKAPVAENDVSAIIDYLVATKGRN